MSATSMYAPEHLIYCIHCLSIGVKRTSRIMSGYDIFLNFYQAATEAIGLNLICLIKRDNVITSQSPATNY